MNIYSIYLKNFRRNPSLAARRIVEFERRGLEMLSTAERTEYEAAKKAA